MKRFFSFILMLLEILASCKRTWGIYKTHKPMNNTLCNNQTHAKNCLHPLDTRSFVYSQFANSQKMLAQSLYCLFSKTLKFSKSKANQTKHIVLYSCLAQVQISRIFENPTATCRKTSKFIVQSPIKQAHVAQDLDCGERNSYKL